MKYLFLDVDGVLNTSSSWNIRYQLNKKLVSNLAMIVKKTDAKLVLSSTWRYGWDNDAPSPQITKLKEYLKEAGIYIEDITPVLQGRSRDTEINRYLYFHPCDKYIVVDDDRREFKDTKNVYFVNPETGLLKKDAKTIAKLLK